MRYFLRFRRIVIRVSAYFVLLTLLRNTEIEVFFNKNKGIGY